MSATDSPFTLPLVGPLIGWIAGNDGVHGISLQEAGKLTAFYWGGAMVGRFVGSALLTRVKAFHLLAINAGSHVNPCRAGDTVYAWSEVLDTAELAGRGDVGALRLRLVASVVLVFFVLHSFLWSQGMFGSAGYERYFVCIGPAIALIGLAGWNAIADRLSWVRYALPIVTTLVLLESARLAILFVDSMPWSRESRTCWSTAMAPAACTTTPPRPRC